MSPGDPAFLLSETLRAAERHASAGRFAEALALFEKALTVAPRDASLHYNAGQLAVRLDDPLSGVKHFRKAIKANPNRSEIHAALGHALITTGEIKQGTASLNRALELNPENAEALCNLGSVMMRE
ncbi:MAG: tetratricopeptide repeat protein, partial [Alphaproteobacteria bacterium]|nr:tetratricopeptide repeat protein [Alphaproteobacteria bacterium]